MSLLDENAGINEHEFACHQFRKMYSDIDEKVTEYRRNCLCVGQITFLGAPNAIPKTYMDLILDKNAFEERIKLLELQRKNLLDQSNKHHNKYIVLYHEMLQILHNNPHIQLSKAAQDIMVEEAQLEKDQEMVNPMLGTALKVASKTLGLNISQISMEKP